MKIGVLVWIRQKHLTKAAHPLCHLKVKLLARILGVLLQILATQIYVAAYNLLMLQLVKRQNC